jgi:acetyltransferase EpsM
MKDLELLILGAGGHAAVVAESAVRSGWRVVAVASREHPAEPSPFGDVEWLGDPDTDEVRLRLHAYFARGVHVLAAVGCPETRERWLRMCGTSARVATVIDPTAVVSPSARIELGAFISTGAVVHARASIGEGAIINTHAVVEHDCVIGGFAHISPGAVLCGSVTVGRAAHVGAGAVVIPGRAIGDHATVGAGAVVARDVTPRTTVIGVPARPKA